MPKLFQGEFHMSPSSLPLLLACLLASASSLPLASTTSQTTATKGAKLPRAPLFRLGRKSAADFQRRVSAATTYKQGEHAAAVATKKPVATLVGDEKKAKAPHCRDTKAGCTHAAKKAAKQAAAKLAPAAQQAEPKQKTAADFLTFGGLSAAIVAKHEEDEEATATPSTSAVHRHPMRAKAAAARASAAASTWSRFDQGEGTGHEDRSGHAGATLRTMPAGGAPKAFSLFAPGAFYP